MFCSLKQLKTELIVIVDAMWPGDIIMLAIYVSLVSLSDYTATTKTETQWLI